MFSSEGPRQPWLLVWPRMHNPGNPSQGQAEGNHRRPALGEPWSVAVRPQCPPEVKGTRWLKTVRSHRLVGTHS